MPPTRPPPQDRAAYRLAETYLADADDRFLPHLSTLIDAKQLVPIAEAWKRDVRPWARQQVVAYLARPLDRPGHEVVVKRLFKQAESSRDDELMAHFTVAFDRLVRRRRDRRIVYDAGRPEAFEMLVVPRNDRVAGWSAWPTLPRKPKRLFSHHTRNHLRRRAWRYYRRTGYGLDGRSAHHDYATAVAAFLTLYTDADVAAGENLLDCWAMVHAMFATGGVLAFGPAHATVAPGRKLAELSAAPAHRRLWERANAAAPLLSLAAGAGCSPVRAWAIELLRGHHLSRLTGVDVAVLLRMLDHADPAVQQFAADLLDRATTLGSLTVADWLRLLQTRNVAALDGIARAMRRHVRPDQLSLAELVDVASAEPVPVARLGLEYLRGRTIAPADHDQVARLAEARSPAVGGDIAAWALGVISAAYDVDPASRFFDAANPAVRSAAFAWVRSPAGAAGYADAALFGRLLETPYDDVRLALVADLKARAAMPGQTPTTLAALWTGVLLGIHRGGRAKLVALRQVSDAVVRDPAAAAVLLPVLAVAIRSVRVPEARVGLVAVVTAVGRSPALADDVQRLLPELSFADAVAV